ncbi:hypothetical protein [Levilactobacillus zymae]|uniref:hypothetical protein n=1 Tax=Levilactobacillus zymae TaxID=267363 RepID=UPI0028B39B49|nr:hypothetical protein [Levilactobacillus zymae]MDT6981540.1 hypothetical protein [Levilactobacillus zymae]
MQNLRGTWWLLLVGIMLGCSLPAQSGQASHDVRGRVTLELRGRPIRVTAHNRSEVSRLLRIRNGHLRYHYIRHRRYIVLSDHASTAGLLVKAGRHRAVVRHGRYHFAAGVVPRRLAIYSPHGKLKTVQNPHRHRVVNVHLIDEAKLA